MTRWLAGMLSAWTQLLLAVLAFFLAVWLAVDTSGGRCDDTSSCIEVNGKLLVFGTLAGVVAFVLWAFVQSRLLRSVLSQRSPRQTTAAAGNVVGGFTSVLVGTALGGWWMWAGLCLAFFIVPGLVTMWAAQPLDETHPYVPAWRRPGW